VVPKEEWIKRKSPLPLGAGSFFCSSVVAVAAAEAAAITTTVAAATVTTAVTASESAFAARRTITCWAVTLGTSKGYGEHTPIHFLTVPTVDSSLGHSLVCHFHEAEAT
jgi:hypothetical protein